MKTTERFSYQVLAFLTIAVLGVAAALGISWIEIRHKAIPLQPAPIAQRAVPQPSEKEANSTRRIGIVNHKVAAGETISLIAELYQIDEETIYIANPGLGEFIHPSDVLVILPDRGALHYVKEGDTLWAIGVSYGVDVRAIVKANNLPGDVITAGQRLFIPGGKLADRRAVHKVRD